MGTTYHISYFTNFNEKQKEEIHQKIHQLLKKLNDQVSTYIKNSEISKFNQSTKNQWHKISPWFMEILTHALDLAKVSDGVFDPTIGPLVNLWGFGPSKIRKIPDLKQISKVKEYIGHEYILLDKKRYSIKKTRDKVMLDLSASAKGFAVDLVSRLLFQYKIQDYLVEIGGEIKVKSLKHKKSWKLAIESPISNMDQSSIHKVLTIKNGALATSGNYRNYFLENKKKYGHTMNYKTGFPVVDAPLSVSILDPQSCMNADALATLLMSMPRIKALEFIKKFKIKAYIISKGKRKNSK